MCIKTCEAYIQKKKSELFNIMSHWQPLKSKQNDLMQKVEKSIVLRTFSSKKIKNVIPRTYFIPYENKV